MKRNLNKLSNSLYDLLVIGGGIYGACVAWDATLRGLSVALVDKGDFGAATSANSMKIIHGGLRYLQDGKLKLVRSMTQERTTWMRIAPHLVHPLPFIMPTYDDFSRSKLGLRAALMLNDSLGFDRNRHQDPQKYLPNGRILSRESTIDKMGWLDPKATGGAMWYDAQIHSSERLLISIILAAAQAGATVANYMQVTDFLERERVVSGVGAMDTITGQAINIRADVVVNCGGAWIDQVLELFGAHPITPIYPLSYAINLVIRKLPLNCAIGFPAQRDWARNSAGNTRRRPTLFVTPWQNFSIVGTWHDQFDSKPQDFRITEKMIQLFIDEVNTSYPIINLKRDDVYHIHSGFLPIDENHRQTEDIKLLRNSRVHDHARSDGIENLISIVGVKYTAARQVAQKAVDLVLHKLGRPFVNSRTAAVPVYGGEIDRFDKFLAQAVAQHQNEISEQSIIHLVHSYGSNYPSILNYAAEEPSTLETITANSPVLKAEIIHAVRKEMAQTLADVACRRTLLGAAGHPDQNTLQACASLVAAEKRWDQDRREKEIAAVGSYYARANPEHQRVA
jgi:glycerol-3-phosphate dehydrogenase